MKTIDAINHFGGRKELADALGIDRSAIHHWGDVVPIARQFQLQIITQGALVASAKKSKPG